MSSISKIQCPACGSNSTFKLFDGNYKCNYCQSNFSVNEAQTNATWPQPVVRPQATAPAKVNSKLVIGFAVGVFLLVGIGTGVFLATGLSSEPVAREILTTTLEKSKLHFSRGFAGSKGAAIWLIIEHNRSSDSVGYMIHVIDPKTKLISGEQIMFPLFKQSSTQNFNTKLGNTFWEYGDLAYNISEDNGFVAYNIYSGKVEINTQSLVKDFPELKTGILKVEELASENAFSITTLSGDVFKFDPYTRTLISKKERPDKRNPEEVTSELYLSNGLKHQLYMFTKSGDGFPILSSGLVDEARVADLKGEKGKNVKDIFGNINIEKVSDKSYFGAQPLLKDDQKNLVLFYKSDLSEKATVILESVNKEGGTNWTLQDSLFLKIGKAFASEDIGAIHGHYKDLLLLFIPSEKQAYMGIDIKNGTILWTFYPEAYLQEHLQTIN